MIRIGVTGWQGRLGSALVSLGCIPIQCDLLDPVGVPEIIASLKLDVIINCAAYHDVAGCELSNTKALVNLRTVFPLMDFPGRVIHISTDYVFDGKKGPYDEKAKPNPVNMYGFAKYGAELALSTRRFETCIVRTSLLYGTTVKPDFASSIRAELRAKTNFEIHGFLRIPNDLMQNPTYIPHLCEALIHLANLASIPKIVNISGIDRISRYEFAKGIASVCGFDPSMIEPIKYVDIVCKRPLKAGLKLGIANKLNLPLYYVDQGLHAWKEQFSC